MKYLSLVALLLFAAPAFGQLGDPAEEYIDSLTPDNFWRFDEVSTATTAIDDGTDGDDTDYDDGVPGEDSITNESTGGSFRTAADDSGILPALDFYTGGDTDEFTFCFWFSQKEDKSDWPKVYVPTSGGATETFETRYRFGDVFSFGSMWLEWEYTIESATFGADGLPDTADDGTPTAIDEWRFEVGETGGGFTDQVITIDEADFDEAKGHFFAVRYDEGGGAGGSDKVTFWIDDTEQSEESGTGSSEGMDSDFYFGDPWDRDVAVYLDNLAVWDESILTDAEVEEIYRRSQEGDEFQRGDANNTQSLTGGDVLAILNCVLYGTSCSTCRETMDTNGDDLLNLADGTYLQNYLFSSGPAPPSPLGSCGGDGDGNDSMTCLDYDYCD